MARSWRGHRQGWRSHQRQEHLESLHAALRQVAVLSGRLQAALGPERWADVEAEMHGQGDRIELDTE